MNIGVIDVQIWKSSEPYREESIRTKGNSTTCFIRVAVGGIMVPKVRKKTHDSIEASIYGLRDPVTIQKREATLGSFVYIQGFLASITVNVTHGGVTYSFIFHLIAEKDTSAPHQAIRGK